MSIQNNLKMIFLMLVHLVGMEILFGENYINIILMEI